MCTGRSPICSQWQAQQDSTRFVYVPVQWLSLRVAFYVLLQAFLLSPFSACMMYGTLSSPWSPSQQLRISVLGAFLPSNCLPRRKSATWPWLKIHCYLAVAISGDWVRFLSLFNADVWFCKPSLYRTSWQHCSSNLPISSNLAFISWEHHPASFSFSWLVRQCGSHKYSTLRFFYCIHFHLSQRTSIWVRIYPNLCLLLYLSLL